MTAPTTSDDLVVEDLLLVLFDPANGVLRGEGQRLFHALAGALLVDLAEHGVVGPDDAEVRGPVRALTGDAPDDELLRLGWELVAAGPRDVQTVVHQIGPRLRGPVIDRLVARGHLTSERRKILGLMPSTRIGLGATGRREQLLADVHGLLVDGTPAGEHARSVAALLFASGSAPFMHPEIPWSGTVHAHGTALMESSRGAAATADAVHQMIAALVASSVFVSLGGAAARE
ncbi:MAG: GOLPH3/VPS74 family protein [Actinomycetaceae bacterium]